MIIPSEEGPNASVRASKETVPVNGQHLVRCTAMKSLHTHHQPVPEDSQLPLGPGIPHLNPFCMIIRIIFNRRRI